MLFAIITKDNVDMLDVRLSTRPDHLKFLENLGSALVFAGPFLDEENSPNGSMVVIEADDLAAAESIAAQDPYVKAGLFGNVEIRGWKWALNNKEGR